MAPEYFDKHRGAAMGFILSGNQLYLIPLQFRRNSLLNDTNIGAGLGGLCLAPVVRLLLDVVGIKWTLRIMGIMTLVVTLPISFVAEWRFGRPQGTRVNISLATKPTFVLQVSATFPFSLLDEAKKGVHGHPTDTN